MTRYFEGQVLRKRPYIRLDWCEKVLADPVRSERQADGGVRLWWKVAALSADRPRYHRLITLGDGVTARNAFLDRDFREVPT